MGTIEIEFSEFYNRIPSWNENNDIISYIREIYKDSNIDKKILLFDTGNEDNKYLIPAIYQKDTGFIQLMVDSKYVLIGELENLKLQRDFIPSKIPENINLRESVNITLVPNIFKYVINIQDVYTNNKNANNDYIMKNFGNLSIKIHLFDSLNNLINFIGDNDNTKGFKKFLSHYYLKEISWVNIKIIDTDTNTHRIEDSFSTFFFKMYISGRTLETSYDNINFSSIIINGERFYNIARTTGPSIASFISVNRGKIYKECPSNGEFVDTSLKNIDENFNIRVYQFKKCILEEKGCEENNKQNLGKNSLVCKFLKSLKNYNNINDIMNHYFNTLKNQVLIFFTAVNYKNKVCIYDENSNSYLQRNPSFERTRARYSEDDIFAVILRR